MFKFVPDRMNMEVELGTGASGCIYPYQKFPEDDRWAIKALFAQDMDGVLSAMQEIVLGFNCENEYILPIKGYHIEKSGQRGYNIYIKMPRMERNLKDVFNQFKEENKHIPLKQIVQYFYSVASGLEYLHETKKIAHRDIKLANILVSKKNEVKIADIGVAKFVPDEETFSVLSEIAGARLYTAPEILAGNKKLKKGDLYKADSWSLGIVMAELCLLRTRLINSVLPGKDIEETVQKELSSVGEIYNPVLKDLLIGLLSLDPENRFTVGRVKKVLEDNFATELGIEKPNIASLSLDLMKKELESKWGMIFNFDANKVFSIKGVNPHGVKSEYIQGFIQDIDHTFESNNPKMIKQLEIDLSCCPLVQDKDVEDVGAYFATNLKKLKELRVKLVECHDVTDNAVRGLMTSVGANLKELQDVTFDFRWCKKLTDLSAKEIRTRLAGSLPKLENFNLSFRCCDKISDKGVRELGALSAHLKSLKKLNMNFQSCIKITDAGIKEFIAQIGANLKTLKSLSLNFKGCYEISDQGVQAISRALPSELKNLEHIELNFESCDKISSQTKFAVINAFNYVPQRVILM